MALDAAQQITLPALDKGSVTLVDIMGDDTTPARYARTSFNSRAERPVEQDRRLVRYLVRHGHTTPLEFCQALFYIKAPLFVVQQILRHRTASVNQVSHRYVTAPPEFYIPSPERMVTRGATQKQGSSEEPIAFPLAARVALELAYEASHAAYENLLREGLAPEIARTVLPTGTYTELYWQCDLHNILGFLGKRMAPDAQWETRQYATAMHALLLPHFPTALAAWKEKCTTESC